MTDTRLLLQEFVNLIQVHLTIRSVLTHEIIMIQELLIIIPPDMSYDY